MTVAYYGWAAWVLDFGTDRGLVVVWLLLSATAVPAFAVVSWWSTTRPGLLADALLALGAATALVNGAARGSWLGLTGAAVPPHVVQTVVEVAVVLVLVLALPRHRSTRLWAAALVLPMWWLAQFLVDALLYGPGLIR